MSDNKYKFSAKRLDNGELIEGSLIHACGEYSIQVENYQPEVSYSITSHDVDPSTITPLFTTDKPDSLIEAAYKEGHTDNTYGSFTADDDWDNSDAKKGMMGGNNE